MVRPYGWIRLWTGENGTRGARHTTIGSVNASGGSVTVVVDVTGSGNEPGIGWRLRTVAVRILVGAGLAAVAWLLGAALGAGTASAAEPSLPATGSPHASSHASNGLLGRVVGTVTGTVTGAVGHLVGNTTTTTTVGTVEPPKATPPKRTATPPATPPASTRTTQRTTRAVPVAVAVPPTTAAVTEALHHTLVVPTRREAVRTPTTTPSVTPHRRFTETPAPHPGPAPAPLAPSPDVPVTVVSAGHSTGDLTRAATAADVPDPAVPTQAGPGGWRADPATPAARCQCLPATSPD